MTDRPDLDALRRLAAALPPDHPMPVPAGWLMALLDGGGAPVPLPAPPERLTGHLERLVGVQEAAARMGVTERYVYRHAGEWPFTRRLGRRTLRFEEAGLEAWLAKRNGRRAA